MSSEESLLERDRRQFLFSGIAFDGPLEELDAVYRQRSQTYRMLAEEANAELCERAYRLVRERLGQKLAVKSEAEAAGFDARPVVDKPLHADTTSESEECSTQRIESKPKIDARSFEASQGND